MSYLRIRTPDGGNHDVWQGESGYAYHGHRFESLWGPSTPARAHRRVLAPRCGAVMRNGGVCARPTNHPAKHSGIMP